MEEHRNSCKAVEVHTRDMYRDVQGKALSAVGGVVVVVVVV